MVWRIWKWSESTKRMERTDELLSEPSEDESFLVAALRRECAILRRLLESKQEECARLQARLEKVEGRK